MALPANHANQGDSCLEPLERRLLLDGETTVIGGILFVRGDEGGNQIHISYTREGVQVGLDNQRELFDQPIRAIEVDAGEGENVIRYRQSVVAGIALDIVTGDGADEIDVEFDLSEARPGSGRRIHLPAVQLGIDAGGAQDRVKLKFAWLQENAAKGPATQFDFAANINPGDDSGALPEIGDEVLIAFEHGDANRPYVIGGLWNSSDPPAAQQTDRLGLRNLAAGMHVTPNSADVSMKLTGGHGPDTFDVNAHYAGVRLQQGRVLLDADLNEGDNRLHADISSAMKNLHVASAITAGNGDNDIALNVAHELTHVVQQRSASRMSTVADVALGDGDNAVGLDVELADRGDHTYHVELGDGDNQTMLRFGDGEHGRRPPTGRSNIAATYRSGAGADVVEIRGQVSIPIDADFTIDPGAGGNTTIARYTFTQAWPKKVVPSQVKVLVLGGGDNDFDLRIQSDSLDPRSGKGMQAVVTGSQIREAGLHFALDRGSLRPGFRGDAALHLHDVMIGGSLAVTMNAGDDGSGLSYQHDRIATETFLATADVQLRGGAGDDMILASLDGISGDGRFRFIADGGAGDDFVATLARNLSPRGNGEMSFDVRGGAGDDVLALAVRPSQGARGAIFARIDGGTGSNRCFATSNVLIENCDHEHDAPDHRLLALLRRFGGKQYGGDWSTST